MSRPIPSFAMMAPNLIPEGERAYKVEEFCLGRKISTLITPYLNEALADMLIKAHRPLNKAVHDGGPEDRVFTRVIPIPAPVMQTLHLEVYEIEGSRLYSVTKLSAFISTGTEMTGLRANSSYRDHPTYNLVRRNIANYLLKESCGIEDVAIALTCCASSQPTHWFWQRCQLPDRA